jgi:hypothetical protein
MTLLITCWTRRERWTGSGSTGRDLDGHLIGGAADAAGADLEHGRQGLDRVLERLDGLAARALGDDRQGVVDDPLGRRGLARVDVGHDPDVPDVLECELRLGRRHRAHHL